MVPAIFVLALLIQGMFLLILPRSLRSNDSTDYVKYYGPVAENMLSGKGMVDTTGTLGTLYPPGFPMILAAEYYAADWLGVDREKLIVRVNMLLMAAGAVLVFWTAEAVFNSEIALLGALLWITYVFNLWLIKQPNSEVPFIPLLFAAVYSFIRGTRSQSLKWMVPCGIMLALATLIRPIALLLAPVLGLAILLNAALPWKKRISSALLIVSVFVLCVLPWEREVYLYTGQIVPLSSNGPSTIIDGLTFTRRSGEGGIPGTVTQLTREIWGQHRELKSTGDVVHCMLAELKSKPGAVIELFAVKTARSWFGTDSGGGERAILAIQMLYLPFCGWGTYMALRRWREQRYLICVFLLLVLYFWGMTVIALSILRYLVPAMAYLLILGAAGVDGLVKRAGGTNPAPSVPAAG
jgi:4-amino-4-deoxy-L-arabinose transferase-like glycosyltransferase